MSMIDFSSSAGAANCTMASAASTRAKC